MTEDVRIIKLLERLRNSTNGNPRWRVVFLDGTENVTEEDAEIGYLIRNVEYVNVPLIITLDGKRRITDLRPLKHADYPHLPGALFDCPACENGPCMCTESSAPCVSRECTTQE